MKSDRFQYPLLKTMSIEILVLLTQWLAFVVAYITTDDQKTIDGYASIARYGFAGTLLTAQILFIVFKLGKTPNSDFHLRFFSVSVVLYVTFVVMFLTGAHGERGLYSADINHGKLLFWFIICLLLPLIQGLVTASIFRHHEGKVL